MRKLKFAWLSVFPLLILSGCWDQSEIEEQAYVVVLGLDKVQDNLMSITFQIANPQVGSTDKGQAQNEPASDVVSFVAPDVTAARELANSVISRVINFGHLRTIVVGENFAKTGMFEHVISTSLRDPDVRREINLIVSKEKASEFLQQNKPKMETRPHKYYMFMQERWRETGHVPYSTLNRFFQRVQGELFLGIYATTQRTSPKITPNEDNYLAGQIPQQGGDPVQMMGSAVFKNGRMIGNLTGEETRYSLLLRRRALARSLIGSYVDPVNPKYRITVRMVRRANTTVKVDVKKDPPVVHVRVPLICQVLSIPSLVDYPRQLDKQRLLRESLEEAFKDRTIELVRKTQSEFQAEPFLWYNEARRNFRTLQEFEAYNWENRYTHAEVDVDYDIRIETFGKQLDPARPQIQARGGLH